VIKKLYFKISLNLLFIDQILLFGDMLWKL